ncbi:MAG: helix-turn-helix transcriptional regulator [Lachnospiraceae bacterium]|nr:helix-turn-helix transcriptional regulator [Lachnospiraceae bacterium]
MNTGEIIKKARKKAGFTQKELGEKLGVSASMIAQYENNTRNPKIETLKKISFALDSSIDYYALSRPQPDGIPTVQLRTPGINDENNDEDLDLRFAIVAILSKIYKNVSKKLVFDSYLEEKLSGEFPAAMYILVDDGEQSFILHQKDIDKLIDFSVSTFPFLINEMKDVRPEEIVFNELKQKISDTTDLYKTLLNETTNFEE